MSQPKRWGLCWTAKVEDPEQGAWVEYADYAAIAAEVERLRESQLSKDKWIACEQMHFQTADNLRDRLYQASMRIERLEKAGNTVVAAYCMGDWNTDKWKEYPVVAQWLAAKEGRDAK